jgi:site-specific DNA-methyltransferase (adenine-specific)
MIDNKESSLYYKTNNCALYLCDNLKLLQSLPDNYVDLIYCDILYGTGRKFDDYQDLKANKEIIEYHYIPRIKEMHRALKETGSIYLQMDTRINHWLRIICDDIFGYDNFVNEICWSYFSGGGSKKKYSQKHDIILFYTKSKNYVFNNPKMKIYQKKKYSFSTVKEYNDDNDKGWYHLANCSDVFSDIQTDWYNNMKNGSFKNNASKRKESLYDTQKPTELLNRIISSSSNENDIVADFYMGSGTTGEVSLKLNRKFIGCDIGYNACKISKERLDRIELEQNDKKFN